ncbi:hypothetical protein Ddc_03097 [Ditylenchus destructor]|nr:hypothetical protein Ddc_03097 [Ditylenchus destructor]
MRLKTSRSEVRVTAKQYLSFIYPNNNQMNTGRLWKRKMDDSRLWVGSNQQVGIEMSTAGCPEHPGMVLGGADHCPLLQRVSQAQMASARNIEKQERTIKTIRECGSMEY